MRTYECWEYEDEDQFAAKVEAYDAEDAAEKYAERCYHNGDPFDRMIVNVRDTNGEVSRLEVQADYEVSFYALGR